MLKKLRMKFVLINMLIVTIMLGVIFGLLYYSTSQNLERESVQMMRNLALSPAKPTPPNKRRGDVHLPYFSILVDREGNAIATDGNFFDLSDTEQIDSLLALTYETNTEGGVLKEYRLRFLCVQTPMGSRVVFADMTSEQSTLDHMIKTFLIVGSAAFLAFLAISILLARWAVKPVDRAWQQQKQFVADASHELKTPLTVITTNAELLQSPDRSDAECQQFAGSILTMTRQMRGLVEGLLTLARVDNGTAKMDFADANLSTLVSDALLPFEPVFFEKGLPLSSDIEPSIHVNGNALQLRQVMEILLDNAQKYASPGGETHVTLTRGGHSRCLFTVANQGVALSDEERAHVFERFYRADKARSLDQSYGLGLSIAQGIVQAHKGAIRCESRDGYNIFTVTLPIKAEKI